MIAAIYARKSPMATEVAEDAKSVRRQVENARAYASRKGWTVAEDLVFVDDNISGAEFARRPSFMRLMAMLKPRAPFQVLIVSEQKSLGRESFETNYTIKRLAEAGVELVEYVHGRSLTPKNWLDKVTAAVLSSADEAHREQTRERVHEAHMAKARRGYVVGGRVFGYRNVDVFNGTDADGRPLRSHVERAINEDEAAVVRRIFELCAGGYGVKRIAATLNAEGAASPRPQRGRPKGWATSSVHGVLFRPLYRGRPVWNQTRKRDDWGRQNVQDRAEDEWLHIEAPQWRIVSDDLWRAAHARLDAARANYLAGTRGAIWGRPTTGTTSKYLLIGIGRCGACGGGLVVRARKHGRGRQFRYACSTLHYRGRTVCANNLQIPVDVADGAILDVVAEEVLRPDLIARTFDDLFAERARPDDRQARRKALAGELARVETEAANLSNAIAAGGDVPTLLAALKAREARRVEVARELEGLQDRASKPLDRDALEAKVRRRLNDWRALCGRQTPDARKLLDLVLADRIVFTPTRTRAGEPAYQLRVPLTYERMFEGLFSATVTRSHGVASPAGVEPASPP